MKTNLLPPDFVLAGAAKCGTTAFFNILCEHPEIFGSPVKEPHYFSNFDIREFSESFRRNNVRDPAEYFANEVLSDRFQLFINDKNQYLRLFAAAPPESIRGEASTSYLFSPIAARRMMEHNPRIKILAILRNPVDRAYSHYNMALKYGYTTDDFLAAIRKDQATQQKGWGKSHLFLELGHYDEQIARYLDLFPRDQLHFIHYGDWKMDPQSTFKEVFRFLGVKPMDLVVNKTQNVGEIPRFRRFNRWLNKAGLRQSMADRFPASFKSKLHSWYLAPKPALPYADVAHLYRYYEPRIERLSELWGRDLASWLPTN